MSGSQVYSVEVDVAIARPPIPTTHRTVYVLVAVSLDVSNWSADVEAREVACQMVAGTRGIGTALPGRWGPVAVMPVAARIVGLTL